MFEGQAERGQCSIGWFHGFKLHLIINDQGEILSFYVTKGNVDDRDWKHFSDMTKAIFGKLFGDKGYVSKALADLLWGNGIQMVAKPKKNMKQVNLGQEDKILHAKEPLSNVSTMNSRTSASSSTHATDPYITSCSISWALWLPILSSLRNLPLISSLKKIINSFYWLLNPNSR